MDIVFFADLDECLLVRPETADSNQPFTMTEAQRTLLDAMWDMGEVVPTTGQTIEEYEALRLPFSSRAIVSHGVTIREPWGEPNKRWHKMMLAEAAAHDATFSDIHAYLRSLADSNVHVRIASEFGVDYRVVAQCIDGSHERASDLEQTVAPQLPTDWRVGRHKGRISVFPPFVRKEKAVTWYRRNLAPKAKLAIGIGDRHSDRAFLECCDFAMLPTDSELFAMLKTARVNADGR